MPGYKIHDASGNPVMMENLAYRKGLNAPDYFKKISSEEMFNKHFEGCNSEEIPSFEEFLELKANDFHFGYSSNPNIEKFLSLEFVNLRNPFWLGYYTHLIGDKEIYDPKNGCVNPEKFKKDGSPKKLLHRDWDITNYIFEQEFGIKLLPEIEDLNVVQYVQDEKPRYIEAQKILECVHRIRKMTI